MAMRLLTEPRGGRVPGASDRATLPILVTMLLGMSLVGCTAIAETVASHLVRESLKQQHLIRLIDGDHAIYRECLMTPGGTCPDASAALLFASSQQPSTAAVAELSPSSKRFLEQLEATDPARQAARALEHPAMGSFVGLHNHLRGHQAKETDALSISRQLASAGSSSQVNMRISLSGVQELAEAANRTTAAGGWSALADRTQEALAQSKPGSPDHTAMAADHRRAVFLRDYTKAYFRNGRFIGIDLQVDETTAIADLKEELAKHQTVCDAFNAASAAGSSATPGSTAGSTGTGSSSDCTALAQKIYRGVLGSQLGTGQKLYLLKIAEVGFTPRDGSPGYQFPSIDVNIDPLAQHIVSLEYGGQSGAKLNFTTVGSDLVRVVLEAVFDAHEGLPAVTGATGLRLDPAEYSLPTMDDLPKNITDHLTEMLKINQGATAAAGVTLDRVIQGIGPLSLNNRAIEDLIVTMVTTSVKKAIEKASWCYYSCELNLQIDEAKSKLRHNSVDLALEIGS